jgi:hypothetical protein
MTRMKNGNPSPGAFEPKGEGLSVDWDRYSTSYETRARAKKPEQNAVVSLVVGEIRRIREGLDVIHSPIPENRAHSEVNLPGPGAEQTEVRIKLSRLATLVIDLDS